MLTLAPGRKGKEYMYILCGADASIQTADMYSGRETEDGDFPVANTCGTCGTTGGAT